MSEKTNIAWCDSTGNPWIGCTKVSPGCKNCYAAELDENRFSKTMGGGTKEKPVSHWGPGAPRVRTKAFWTDAMKWQRLQVESGAAHHGATPPRIFPSLCDWLDDEVPIEWLADFLKLIHDTPNLDWLLLTKRPENYWERVSAANALLRKRKDAAAVTLEMAQTKIEKKPVNGFPGYFITNAGTVLTDTGSVWCLWCGAMLGGTARRKYCGQPCRQSAHHHGDKHAITPVEMSPDTSEDGYQRVMLYRKGETFRELVHKLVLSHFAGPQPTPEHEGCHRDGNPSNNHICNLRWGTQSENWQDRKRHGNHRSNWKLTPLIAEVIKVSPRDPKEIAEQYGVTEATINNIKAGKIWTSDDFSMPSNCWLGVSVEDQKRADERIPLLVQIPARVRFLSVEPLLEKVDLMLCRDCGEPSAQHRMGGQEHSFAPELDGIHWIIVGLESGKDRRDAGVEALIDVANQGVAAGIPVFTKQDCAFKPGQQGRIPDDIFALKQFPLSDPKDPRQVKE